MARSNSTLALMKRGSDAWMQTHFAGHTLGRTHFFPPAARIVKISAAQDNNIKDEDTHNSSNVDNDSSDDDRHLCQHQLDAYETSLI